MNEKILEELQKIFNSTFGADSFSLTEKTPIKDILYISSFSYIILISEIEQYYHIEIPNSVLRKFVTVKDVIKYLKRKL